MRECLDLVVIPLTVDNHADGAYLSLEVREEDTARGEDVPALLRWNGGVLHSSGVGVPEIDFSCCSVMGAEYGA